MRDTPISTDLDRERAAGALNANANLQSIEAFSTLFFEASATVSWQGEPMGGLSQSLNQCIVKHDASRALAVDRMPLHIVFRGRLAYLVLRSPVRSTSATADSAVAGGDA